MPSNPTRPSAPRTAASLVSQPRTMSPRSPCMRITSGRSADDPFALSTLLLPAQSGEHGTEHLVDLRHAEPPGAHDIPGTEHRGAEQQRDQRAEGVVTETGDDGPDDGGRQDGG